MEIAISCSTGSVKQDVNVSPGIYLRERADGGGW